MSKERFTVEDCDRASDERVFRNGKCVYNNRLGFAYSVDEIVEVLNNRNYQSCVYELMQNKIWWAQGMGHRTGDEKYKLMETVLKELREELYEPSSHSMKYAAILKEWFLESQKEKEDTIK